MKIWKKKYKNVLDDSLYFRLVDSSGGNFLAVVDYTGEPVERGYILQVSDDGVILYHGPLPLSVLLWTKVNLT